MSNILPFDSPFYSALTAAQWSRGHCFLQWEDECVELAINLQKVQSLWVEEAGTWTSGPSYAPTIRLACLSWCPCVMWWAVAVPTCLHSLHSFAGSCGRAPPFYRFLKAKWLKQITKQSKVIERLDQDRLPCLEGQNSLPILVHKWSIEKASVEWGFIFLSCPY